MLRARDGAVSIIVALALTALLGLGALSIDLGRAWNLETELQNAADAAALACAGQLDRQANARARGNLAATGTLVQNTQTFASDGAGSDVTIQAGDIVFLEDLVTRAVATTDQDAKYCQVTISPRRVDFSFAQIVGAVASASPRAVAVAGLDTARCKVPPIMICNPNEPGPFDVMGHIADGITLKESTGGGLAPGNFGLLALYGKVLSTNETRDAWARTNPLTQCFGEEVTTKPGQATAISQGLNMRFDIYFQGTHKVPAGESPVQSNPFYVPSMNNVKGLLRSSSNCSYQHPQGWNDAAQKYTGPGGPPPTSMGFPRDDCAYNGDWCDTYNGGTNFGDGVWDIATYFTTNHPGVAPSVVPDLYPNDGHISRYEVYRWELQPPPPTLAEGEPEPNPVCHSSPYQTNPDRRAITVAVLDCSGVKGTMNVTPVAWVDLFLTEPMGVFNGNNDLYGEIIGPGNPVGGGVVRYILQLAE